MLNGFLSRFIFLSEILCIGSVQQTENKQVIVIMRHYKVSEI